MKNFMPTIAIVLAISFFAHTVFSQGFPYHLYDTRTLFELNELNLSVADPSIDSKTHLMISAKPFYSAIRFEYMGVSRKLSKKKMGLFKLWIESMDIRSSNTDDRLASLLDKEFLFKECDKEYWIPVQIPAAKDFPKDFKKGDRITLYLMMVGGIKTRDSDWDFVYFTNSFKNIQVKRIPLKTKPNKEGLSAP